MYSNGNNSGKTKKPFNYLTVVLFGSIILGATIFSTNTDAQSNSEDFSTRLFFYHVYQFDNEEREDTGFIRTSDSLKSTVTGDVDGHGLGVEVNGKYDDLEASFRINSESTLSEDQGVRAVLGIRIYNQLQENGFPEREDRNSQREGDVQARIKVRMHSDAIGGPRVEGCFSRRNGEGNSENYNIVDGDDCFIFNTVPEFLIW